MEFAELRQIHAGARFVVSRARRGGRSVIIKTLRPGRDDAQSENRLRQEYALLTDLALPGVVRPISFEQLEHRPALVMADAGAQNLDEWLRGRRLDVRSFLQLATQMAAIVAGLHRQNIIHRDLCPSNFVIGEHGRVTLIDFELASPTGLAQTSVQIDATLPYLAPEQTGRMKRLVDHRADLYVLGATFYQMLLGAPPFTSPDPLEVVHAHLAQTPVAPILIRPELPQVLSEMVMKLLAKMPEWRYQSAETLRIDLEEAERRWLTSASIERFELARLDRRELQLSRGLYGRGREQAALRAAFERTARGENQLVAVSGFAGIGKTALIEQMRAEFEQKSWFLAGKCDQLTGNVPFAVFAELFRTLAQKLEEAGEDLSAEWHSRVARAVHPHGRVLTQIVPEFAPFLGDLPQLPQLAPTEAGNRAELTLGSFIRALGTPERPLVLFLDDIQWADPASLKLALRLASEPDLHHLLIILAWRSEEVGPEHPVSRGIEDARRTGVRVDEIALGPLDTRALTSLLAETLHTDPAHCSALADTLAQKTAGNPLFAQHFLRLLQGTGQLIFDAKADTWRWDLALIAETPASKEVIDLLVASLKRLPGPVQDALTVAACIGNRFELGLVAKVLGLPTNQVARALSTAVREMLVAPVLQLQDEASLPTEGYQVSEDARAQAEAQLAYRFVHDRIQQAAYALACEQRSEQLHVAIGRELLARTRAGDHKQIFAVVDHLNRGTRVLKGEAERQELLWLNERAATKAKSVAGYAAALAYLRQAIELLPSDAWSSRRPLAFRLHRDAAELSFVTAEIEQAYAFSEVALAHAASRFEKADLYLVRVTGYSLRLDVAQATRAGAEGLSLFGLILKPENLDAVIETASAAVEQRLAGRAPTELLDAPLAHEPEHITLQQLLSELAPIMYQSDPKRLALVTLWATEATLAHGHSTASPHIYAVLGVILVGRGQYERGYAFGRMAIELADKLGAAQGRTRLVFALLLNHWRAPFRSTLSLLRTGVAQAIEAGDLLLASYGHFGLLETLPVVATDLDSALSTLEENLAFCRKVGSALGIEILVGARQALRCLKGLTRERGRFDDAEFDEEAFLAGMHGHKRALGDYASVRLWVASLLGDHARALAMTERATPLLPFFILSAPHVQYVFHSALALAAAAAAEQASSEERALRIAQMAPFEATLRTWSDSCPENFRHMHDLVCAELLRLQSPLDPHAEDLYHRAIDGANRESLLQDEAMAQERYGRYCFARGRRSIAAHWLHAALATYARWGATAKVELLQEELEQLALPVVRPALPTSAGEATSLDVLTLFKAAEALSSEVVLDRLLDKVTRICVETAGAQRGSFVVERDGELRVEAHFESRRDRTGQRAQARAESQVSAAIVWRTLRTGQDVVLGNAAEDSEFQDDRYVLAASSKSILSIAVRHHGRITAVLFLENELLNDAFTEERLKMLRLLLSQAAISLENARLYDSLRANEALLRDFFEGMPVGVYVVDGQGRGAFANRRAKEIVGYSYESNLTLAQLISKYPLWVAGRDEPYPHNSLPMVRALRGETVMVNDLELRRSDRTIPLSVWGTPIHGDDGSVRYAIMAFQDISEQRTLEAQLRQAQRLESIGRLAGGIAHDFNNLLTPMLVYSELAARTLPEGSTVRHQISQIQVAAEHAAGLTRQLLAFGRQQSLEPRVIDLNAEIRSFERMFRRLLRENIELELALSPDLEKVRADPAQLQRVFGNLGMNAADAMPQGGRLTLETANRGAFVVLRVRDSGHGMSKETLARIFDPFFTTKGVGAGSGLGLPAVYGVVTQHGGRIEVQSEPGKGTTFEVLLPRFEEHASDSVGTPEAGPMQPQPPLGRGETLLVVDDDEGVRKVVEEVLVHDGYHVVSTSSPLEALRIARDLGQQLDLLITDLIMPGMDGRELVAQLRRERPLLKALFISGYVERVRTEPGEVPGSAPEPDSSYASELLPKPLSVNALRARVHRMLR